MLLRHLTKSWLAWPNSYFSTSVAGLAKAQKRKLDGSPKDEGPVKKEEQINHWLIKSEPDPRMENGVDVSFSFAALQDEPDQTACWDGVRNYSARNFMRAMKAGEQAFFYHSNTKPPGIIGVVDVVKEAYVDHTQFDRKDPHYDPKSKKVHLEHKAKGGPLAQLAMFTKARLSVQPITGQEWDFILQMEDKK